MATHQIFIIADVFPHEAASSVVVLKVGADLHLEVCEAELQVLVAELLQCRVAVAQPTCNVRGDSCIRLAKAYLT